MTTIEWTRSDDGSPGRTWNPTVGCSQVSEGCRNCYAIGVAHRAMQPAHEGLTVRTKEGIDWTGEVRCLPERLSIPMRRKKPTRWFVDSMSDLFHPDVPEEFIGRVFNTMAATPQHTFQILTKRPHRMAVVVNSLPAKWHADDALSEAIEAGRWPLPNVWCGTSIESDRYTFRARQLSGVLAAIRFLSLEPLLGPLPSLDLEGVSWVIVGGESGSGARPMHVSWARDLRDACQFLEIPFFFKQWGAWGWPARPTDHALTIDGRLFAPGARLGMDHLSQPTFVRRVGKKAAGRVLDGRTWDEFPTAESGRVA